VTPRLPGRETLARLLRALIADEMEVQGRRAPGASVEANWGDGSRIDEDGLGFDSLGRLDLAARVNSYFHLHEVGIEDYLLIAPDLGGWLDIIEKSLAIRFERITFRTSGSTGTPKPVTHAVALLDEEVSEISALLDGAKRIIGLVPAHHIYGFLFTIRLPEALGIPFLDARAIAPGRLAGLLAAGDAIVATPHLYGYLLRSGLRFPDGVRGISSTGPLPAETRAALAGAGLSDITEIYGSSETAGIGHRRSGGAPFALFHHWRRDDHDHLMREGLDAPVMLPDEAEWLSPTELRPVARRDGGVKIGGINVFPTRIAETLREHPLVRTCALRPVDPDGDASRRRLSAFIVLSDETVDEAAAQSELLRFCAQHLRAVERPVSLTFGRDLPRNAIGKLAAW
jgi:long-chain acyl-CoA synthetase